jgi:drug/metabolite transporter (DMT)-like permease
LPNSLLPYIWMLCGSLSFAIMGTLAHALHDWCDWRIVALARTGLALVFSLVLATTTGAKLVFLRPFTLWMRSIAGSISLMTTFYALAHLPVGVALTLNNTFPLWVSVLSWPLLGERPGGKVWIAVLCGITGVALTQWRENEPVDWVAIIAVCGSVMAGVAMIGLHKLQGIDSRSVVVHFSMVATSFCVVATVLSSFTGTRAEPVAITDWPWMTWAMLLGLGMAATSGQLLLTKAFAAGPPARVSVVGLTQIVFGVILDRILWGHHLTAAGRIGILLVILPTAWVILSQGKPQVEDI